MTAMEYKGYLARIEFSKEDESFVGQVAGIRDPIAFHGNSVRELKRNFADAIETYLDACKDMGREPDRQFSGKFIVRMSPEDHRKLATEAESEGASLNDLVKRRLLGHKAA